MNVNNKSKKEGLTAESKIEQPANVFFFHSSIHLDGIVRVNTT